jgi:uridine phosphorylase
MQMKKDIHLTSKDLTAMVQLRPEDVGKYAIVPGPADRLQSLLKKLENPVRNFSFMEYSMYTGYLNGVKITAMNGGRFSPDTAITTEIICESKIPYIIRIGSCGALREDIKIGDLIVVESSVRGDGVTPYYVDSSFKTTSDADLTKNILDVIKSTGKRVHTGSCWTTDALLQETRQRVDEAVKKGAIAVDMVTSTLLTIAQLKKVKAAVILAVSDNIITGEMGFVNPLYYMAESAMIDIALNTVKKLEGKA